MIVLSVLLMPAMIIRFYQGWFQMLLHRPAALHGVNLFHLQLLPGHRRKSSSPGTGYGTFLYLPFLMALASA